MAKEVTIETMVCRDCKTETPLARMRKYRRVNGIAYGPTCNPCNSAAARAWYHRNKDRADHQRHAWNLRHLYGLTAEEYDVMLFEQDHRCAICRKPQTTKNSRIKRLSVDHDRRTGRVRGLLCGSCNRALGLVNHDPERLHRMLEYLGG